MAAWTWARLPFSSVNGNNPRLYSLDVTLSNTTSPVTSIDFAYASGSGHGAIMAVSGSKGAAFTPIAVTGYNEDIVVEGGRAAPGRFDRRDHRHDGDRHQQHPNT